MSVVTALYKFDDFYEAVLQGQAKLESKVKFTFDNKVDRKIPWKNFENGFQELASKIKMMQDEQNSKAFLSDKDKTNLQELERTFKAWMKENNRESSEEDGEISVEEKDSEVQTRSDQGKLKDKDDAYNEFNDSEAEVRHNFKMKLNPKLLNVGHNALLKSSSMKNEVDKKINFDSDSEED